MLYQSGPRDAKIMVVGDCVAHQDAAAGKPFVGYTGDLLTRMLGAAGIRREECFITFLVHEPQPGGNFEVLYKKQNEMKYLQGLLQLKKDISDIRPNLVIALGGHVLRALTKKHIISDWRGSILESYLVPGQKVIATYHPSQVLKTWDYKAVVELDFQRCAREKKFPEIKRPKREFFLNPEPAVRQRLVEEMAQAEWLSTDIECWQDEQGKWKLACVGFSDRPDRALVIPYHENDPLSTFHIQYLLTSAAKKVFQNGNFDVSVLREMGMEVRNFAWDTMLAHHTLYTECASGGDEISSMTGKKRQSALSKGLAFLTSIYTDEPRYKDDGKLWKETGDLTMFWRYNALDAMVTLEIRHAQEPELTDFGVMHIFEQSMQLCDPIMSATARGIKIDLQRRQSFLTEYGERLVRLQKFLDMQAGGPVNVSSSKQMFDLLYGKLGLPQKINRKSGRATANKDAIVELAEKHKHPLLMTILKIRETRVMLERYIGANISADGRMRCSFDITGTRTGRLASRASLDGTGTNLQNIPVVMREMFIADPGKVFVYRDYAQADARVVAYLARDQYLIDLFNDPTKDLHKITASTIFGKPVEEITYEERFLGKKCRHAVNYDMQADRFVQVVNEDSETTGVTITKAMAKRVIEGFFMMHPNHKPVFWGGVQRNLRQSRMLVNGFGRKRLYFGRMDDKLIRDGYSWIPQSTVGDLARYAIVNIWKHVQLAHPEWGVEFLNQVHDSILVQCYPQYVREVAEAMEIAMAVPIVIEGQTFLIPSDCKVGLNWADRHKDGTNPDGLRDLGTWLKEWEAANVQPSAS